MKFPETLTRQWFQAVINIDSLNMFDRSYQSGTWEQLLVTINLRRAGHHATFDLSTQVTD